MTRNFQALESRALSRPWRGQSSRPSRASARAFRAGGNPIPRSQGRRPVNLVFKPYGTAIAFQPMVRANGPIQLGLDAENEVDPATGFRVNGFVAPSLLVRHTTTTIDVQDRASGSTTAAAIPRAAFRSCATAWCSRPRLGSLGRPGRPGACGRGQRRPPLRKRGHWATFGPRPCMPCYRRSAVGRLRRSARRRAWSGARSREASKAALPVFCGAASLALLFWGRV